MRALGTILAMILFVASPARHPIAAAELPDFPGIGQKFEWCAQATSPREKIERYELFWGHYHPKDEEYDDDIQGRLVRRCAYRLSDLYARVGDIQKARHFLKWLEEHDSAWIR